MSCPRCDRIRRPDAVEICYFWPPEGHVQAKLHALLAAAGLMPEWRAADRVLVARIDDQEGLCRALEDGLSAQELRDTNALALFAEPPTMADFGRIERLDVLARRGEAQWLADLIEENRYQSYLQPIVALDGAGEHLMIKGYEFLLRGFERGGELVSPARIFGAARDPALLFALDRRARINAIETAARFGLGCTLFVNFMPSAIYDPSACLGTTVAAAGRCGLDPRQIVFEVVESERYDDLDHLRTITDYYRDNGFRVALDDYGAGFNNLTTFLALRPDFIKLDKALSADITHDALQREMVGRMIDIAHAAGVQIIAEGVETAAAFEVLRSLGADLYQGYLFGRPQAEPQATLDTGIATLPRRPARSA